MSKKRKQRLCRICKKRPVWIGGDVKNPGPVCKKCYHAHVWPERQRRRGQIVQGADTPEQKKVVKQQEPNNKMRPARNKRWSRAKARFHLSSEELAMAQAAHFTPIRMDEMATGRKRCGNEELPLTATADQIETIKRLIPERYAIQLKRKQRRLGMDKLTVTIPTELKMHVTAKCARAGLILDDEIQALLETRFSFSRDDALPEQPPGDPVAEVPSQPTYSRSGGPPSASGHSNGR